MALLDQVLGSLLGGNTASGGGGNAPMASVLAGLLGGGQQAPGSGPVTAAPAPGNAFGGNAAFGGGGLAGLVSAFENAGLGHVAQSWVGNGPNQGVTPQQLQQVFGQQQVQQWAEQTGMPQNDFLGQLAQHLPQAVDRMTPNGRIPDEGRVSV
jgi:uncharacterized protein YidB (DUF937 family)